MTPLHDLQIKAIKIADFFNKEIVANAWYRYLNEYHCKKCQYVNNKEKFAYALTHHTELKITLHRLFKYYPHHTDKIEIINNQLSATLEVLNQLWPCEECIRNFNPTNRTRGNYNGQRKART